MMVFQALPEATSDALLACIRNQAECAAYRGRYQILAVHMGLESSWALDCREWKELPL